MLLTHDNYRQFTSPLPIGDPTKSSQAICCACRDDRREAVDASIAAAVAAGGAADRAPKQDFGVMYGRSIADPDGHHFELMWMDPAAAEQGASGDRTGARLTRNARNTVTGEQPMTYVEGFVCAVPTARKDESSVDAESAGRHDQGVRRHPNDVENCHRRRRTAARSPIFRARSRRGMTKQVFSWFEYPDKATRDACQREDGRSAAHEGHGREHAV